MFRHVFLSVCLVCCLAGCVDETEVPDVIGEDPNSHSVEFRQAQRIIQLDLVNAMLTDEIVKVVADLEACKASSASSASEAIKSRDAVEELQQELAKYKAVQAAGPVPKAAQPAASGRYETRCNRFGQCYLVWVPAR